MRAIGREIHGDGEKSKFHFQLLKYMKPFIYPSGHSEKAVRMNDSGAQGTARDRRLNLRVIAYGWVLKPRHWMKSRRCRSQP